MMGVYRFTVTDYGTHEPQLKDEWTAEHPDDDTAWKVCRDVVLSGHQQVLVYRDGEKIAFGSKVSDELADAWDAEAWRS